MTHEPFIDALLIYFTYLHFGSQDVRPKEQLLRLLRQSVETRKCTRQGNGL